MDMKEVQTLPVAATPSRFSRMKQAVENQRARVQAVMAMMLLAAVEAHADLPTLAAPTGGEVDGDFMLTFRNYGIMAIAIVGGLLVSGIMIAVVKNAMYVYHEIGEGKKKWSDLTAHALGGTLLIVISVFIATRLAPVMENLGE